MFGQVVSWYVAGMLLVCVTLSYSVLSTINSSRPEHTKRTQGNAEQHKATHAGQAEPTQPKQHQQTKNQQRGSRTLLETTNDRKPNPTHQPQAAPIETTTQGLPQPHRPSQPNLPRTTLDPTRHPRQHRTRTSNVQAPHGITPCGVCARYSSRYEKSIRGARESHISDCTNLSNACRSARSIARPVSTVYIGGIWRQS